MAPYALLGGYFEICKLFMTLLPGRVPKNSRAMDQYRKTPKKTDARNQIPGYFRNLKRLMQKSDRAS
uniref:Uncharacterized protein n=1 Tax=Candidatus Kentrum sp. DK TaxID=2126562 RepID=A0A450SLA6_9GAMM|nr:MAG: hypothetical protein BECKDK2373B_GA0170837_104625 [Candidatus Kentron sp. DK]